MGIKVTEGIKVANYLPLRRPDYPGLPGWVRCSRESAHKCQAKCQAGQKGRVKCCSRRPASPTLSDCKDRGWGQEPRHERSFHKLKGQEWDDFLESLWWEHRSANTLSLPQWDTCGNWDLQHWEKMCLCWFKLLNLRPTAYKNKQERGRGQSLRPGLAFIQNPDGNLKGLRCIKDKDCWMRCSMTKLPLNIPKKFTVLAQACWEGLLTLTYTRLTKL